MSWPVERRRCWGTVVRLHSSVLAASAYVSPASDDGRHASPVQHPSIHDLPLPDSAASQASQSTVYPDDYEDLTPGDWAIVQSWEADLTATWPPHPAFPTPTLNQGQVSNDALPAFGSQESEECVERQTELLSASASPAASAEVGSEADDDVLDDVGAAHNRPGPVFTTSPYRTRAWTIERFDTELVQSQAESVVSVGDYEIGSFVVADDDDDEDEDEDEDDDDEGTDIDTEETEAQETSDTERSGVPDDSEDEEM